jgi:hypothetical protein
MQNLSVVLSSELALVLENFRKTPPHIFNNFFKDTKIRINFLFL